MAVDSLSVVPRQVASAAVRHHHLEERDSAWLSQAPLVVSNEVFVPASAADVFAVLADIGNWQSWCTGVSETEVVGPLATGVGARRKVKAGGVRFEERFVTWEDGVRVTFSGLTTSAPGFRSLVEDWSVVPDPADPSKSVLTQTMGVALSGTLRPLAGALRWYLQRATRRGALGMAKHFA
jgi:Polyketide cyclase / dehydrase and lipid transport